MILKLTQEEAITLGLAIHHSIEFNNEMLKLGLEASDYRKEEIEKLKTIQSKIYGTESKCRLEATA